MFIESLHKVIIAKSLAFLMAVVGGFIREHREEDQDDVPGDNFPHAVMFR